MKRIVVLIVMALVFVVLAVNKNIDIKNFNSAKVYTDKTNIFIEDTSRENIDNYSAYITDAQNINRVINNLEHCYAIEYTYQSLDIDEIINEYNARIVKIEILHDVTIYYLYSKQISPFINSYNESYNIQVALSKKDMKIGIPQIISGI